MARSRSPVPPGGQDLIGTLLNDVYRVERLIGRGGMGAVYVVRNERTEGLFAAKVLHPWVAQDPALYARFFSEAKATSALRHPGIIQIIDLLHLPDGSPCLIMEYLEGEDLKARLERQGRLVLGQAITICREIGLALHAAHKIGIVHRDVKPSNIFLVRQERGDDFVEQPKLIDFGVARIRGSEGTPTWAVIGTPLYMSPEAAMGFNHIVDARSDQYSLAVILCQLVSGIVPHPGDVSAETDIVDVRLGRKMPLDGVPDPLRQAIGRALSLKPESRFPSVMAFLDVLQACEAGAAPALSYGESIAEAARKPPRGGGARKRILILDDDAGITWMLEELLRLHGYACHVLHHPAGLPDALRSFEPDLVLLDVCLPERSGYHLCWKLKSARPDLPVILLSAKSNDADHQMGEAMRADAYIDKPFELEHVVGTIRSLLADSLPQDS